MQKKWALVSVFDKTGIAEFCRKIEELGYGILSTGGTARHLKEQGIPVTEVESYTGFPEMLDGRVKTLHPRIHAGLLALRDNSEHLKHLETHQIDFIDLVVVNLYPFEATIAKPNVTFEEAIEMIDIGGPSMLRAAAKNHRFCAPVVDPADYTSITDALSAGGLTEEHRAQLARKVFSVTADYDARIAAYLSEQEFRRATSGTGAASPSVSATSATSASAPAVHEHATPDLPHHVPGINEAVVAGAQDFGSTAQGGSGSAAAPTAVSTAVSVADGDTNWPNRIELSYVKKQTLRYGENPHQAACFYSEASPSPASIAGATQLQGKELSYNNIQDADAALSMLRAFDDFEAPVVVAVKHMNPCGIGSGETIHEAFAQAYEADPVSIFGGIIACNRPVDGALADKLTDMFLEIVMAPEFTAEAREKFTKKKNVRLLIVDVHSPQWKPGDVTYRRVSGGLLVQEVDAKLSDNWQVVTKRTPTDAEKRALDFAWRVVKFVKSNAIVVASDKSTLGVGAGQMNRVGAAQIAITQAGARVKGAVMASDAFFPMRDTVEAAAAAGITAIIQPGGSMKDKDSIEAADEFGIAMVFTGERHFLH